MAVFRIEKREIYRHEQLPFSRQGIVAQGDGLVLANTQSAGRAGLDELKSIPARLAEAKSRVDEINAATEKQRTKPRETPLRAHVR